MSHGHHDFNSFRHILYNFYPCVSISHSLPLCLLSSYLFVSVTYLSFVLALLLSLSLSLFLSLSLALFFSLSISYSLTVFSLFLYFFPLFVLLCLMICPALSVANLFSTLSITITSVNITLPLIVSYQLKLIKMHAKLANLNDCAVPFLSRATTNLCWYYYTHTISDKRLYTPI